MEFFLHFTNNTKVMRQLSLFATFMQPNSVIHQSHFWIERKDGGHLHLHQ